MLNNIVSFVPQTVKLNALSSENTPTQELKALRFAALTPLESYSVATVAGATIYALGKLLWFWGEAAIKSIHNRKKVLCKVSPGGFSTGKGVQY